MKNGYCCELLLKIQNKNQTQVTCVTIFIYIVIKCSSCQRPNSKKLAWLLCYSLICCIVRHFDTLMYRLVIICISQFGTTMQLNVIYTEKRWFAILTREVLLASYFCMYWIWKIWVPSLEPFLARQDQYNVLIDTSGTGLFLIYAFQQARVGGGLHWLFLGSAWRNWNSLWNADGL